MQGRIGPLRLFLCDQRAALARLIIHQVRMSRCYTCADGPSLAAAELPQLSVSEVHNAPAGDEVRSPFKPPPTATHQAHAPSPAAAVHSHRPREEGPGQAEGDKKRKRPQTPTPVPEGPEKEAKPKKDKPAKVCLPALALCA